jgi:hypothetical protein
MEMNQKVYMEFQEIKNNKKKLIVKNLQSANKLPLKNQIFTEETGSAKNNIKKHIKKRSQSMYENMITSKIMDQNPTNVDLLTIKNFVLAFKDFSISCTEDYNFKQLKRKPFIENRDIFLKIKKVITKNFTLIDEMMDIIWENETTPVLADDLNLHSGLFSILNNIIDIASIPSRNPWKTNIAQTCSLEIPGMRVLEQQMNIFFVEWGRNEFYKNYMINKIYKSLNKKRPDSLSLINVKDYSLNKEIYRMSNMRIIKIQDEEVVFEFDCIFKGLVCIDLDFTFMLDTSFIQRDINIELSIPIREIVSVIRFKYRPREIGKSWFCFMGIPQMKYELKPKINDIDFDLNLYLFNIGDIIIKNGFENIIYPQWTSVGIPMTKKRKLFKPGS